MSFDEAGTGQLGRMGVKPLEYSTYAIPSPQRSDLAEKTRGNLAEKDTINKQVLDRASEIIDNQRRKRGVTAKELVKFCIDGENGETLGEIGFITRVLQNNTALRNTYEDLVGMLEHPGRILTKNRAQKIPKEDKPNSSKTLDSLIQQQVEEDLRFALALCDMEAEGTAFDEGSLKWRDIYLMLTDPKLPNGYVSWVDDPEAPGLIREVTDKTLFASSADNVHLSRAVAASLHPEHREYNIHTAIAPEEVLS